MRDIFKFFCAAIIENFDYRQLPSFWRFLGNIGFLRRDKIRGEVINRRGF
ncbi:conserved hypothetical protein [Carboxydothermus hydrogenoformans Z-2901]|uniref:Uncharacterized protein n=1 Tax=Carboxydothermus hydrogenoformans (strain ATCC BAA-161 / DSM 6008 / Z-2901) TaxID=246194 RepID=Q3AF50_CARHZ|nr:conserved hypothetical protein [Carboxydothermus hydrogenoformans Z-2901]